MISTVVRLDAELVRRGLARSRGRASDLVAQGRVSVDGAVVTKPSVPVAEDSTVVVAGERDEYVSRAAHKLAGALDALGRQGPVVTGHRCLDAGASTGGFTQVLLEHGARQVHAVDVGHGQIADVVARDPRVVVIEGMNIRDLTPTSIGGQVGVVVADLSFISLRTVVAPLVDAAEPGASLLLLVKPQFEVGRARLGSSGVVKSPTLRAEAVHGVAEAALAHGLTVRAVVPSALAGPSGNREYFLWLVRESETELSAAPRAGLADAVRAAVTDDVVGYPGGAR